MFDVLVIGCGLCGMVVARELADRNIKVHIIEKRNHIGGNIFDYIDKNGILVQKYGPHVFFTDNPEIEKYVTRFVPLITFMLNAEHTLMVWQYQYHLILHQLI